MLLRNSILLGAAVLGCASVIGVTVAVSSAGAANPPQTTSQHSLGVSPTVESFGGDDAQPATLEERVALFKARLQEWGPPLRPNRALRAPVMWQATTARRRPAIATAGSSAPPLLTAAYLGTAPDSLASLRASGDQHCLATAIYYEARNQPLAGQEAVAQVIMNRVGKTQFADNVCGVVVQGGEKRGCQFSFVCDGSMSRPPRDAQAWATAEDVAARTLRGSVTSAVGGATFYHADYVSPWWSKVLPRVAQIGAHIFYDGLDSATSALRGSPLLGRPIASPLAGGRPSPPADAPLLPGGLLGGA